MKIAIVLVCMTMFVATQAFGDNFRRMALFNTVSGRSPFDFRGLFGGSAAARPRTGLAGMQGSGGLGNMGMLLLVGGGEGFFGM